MPIIELEAIGDDVASYLKIVGVYNFNYIKYDFKIAKTRPWVREITGIDDQFKLKYKFLNSHKDYSHANGKGSRGVYLVFNIKNQVIYERFEWVSWKRTYRCFFRYENNKEIEMQKEEVIEWLKNH